MANRITELLHIKYPIIQAGMLWCSPWELAAAVSNAGGLGIIGAASMYPDVLKTHVRKCKEATNKPFAVNMPLLYPNIEEHMQTVIDEKFKQSVVDSMIKGVQAISSEYPIRDIAEIQEVDTL